MVILKKKETDHKYLNKTSGTRKSDLQNRIQKSAIKQF